jgi:hypothetical protein
MVEILVKLKSLFSQHYENANKYPQRKDGINFDFYTYGKLKYLVESNLQLDLAKTEEFV